jgi:hypothetical protein
MTDDQSRRAKPLKRFESFLLRNGLGHEAHDAQFKAVLLKVAALKMHETEQESEDDQGGFNEGVPMKTMAFDDFVAG